MINRLSALLFLLSINVFAMADSDLPIDTLGSKDAAKPLVLYISGDGGFNSFSTSFAQQWNSLGYPVVSLNARSYFWKAKQPQAAAADIAALAADFMNRWKRTEVILIGYSFGADVLPFIQTRLPVGILDKIKHSVLLSPSGSTDFTIHLFYGSGGSSVPAEINKLTKPTLVIFGKEETDTPEKQISNRMATIVSVPGDHHYDSQVVSLVSEIVKRL